MRNSNPAEPGAIVGARSAYLVEASLVVHRSCGSTTWLSPETTRMVPQFFVVSALEFEPCQFAVRAPVL